MIEAVELGLASAVLALRVVEVAADEARVQVLDDVAQPALGEEQDLVGVGALAQALGDPGHNGAAEHRQALHQRLEGDALLRVAAGELPGLGVVLGPRDLGIEAEGTEQRLEEADRHLGQLVERAVLVPLEELRLDGPDGFRDHHPALLRVTGEPVRHLGKKIARPLGHIGAL